MIRLLAEDLEVFAGFEANGLAGRDGDLGAGARVAADAGLARLDGEDAEAPKLDAAALAKGVLHGFKDGIHGRFRLGAWETGALDHSLDEVLFDQWRPPSLPCPGEAGTGI